MAGFEISAKGLDEAVKHMRERAQRFSDLRPALKAVGREIELRTDTAFRDSKSPFGEAFPPLAPSTLASRARKLPGAKKRGKGGKLTGGALKKRSEAIAAYQGGATNIFKPLVDTARARNSQHVDIDVQSLKWSAVGYLGPHMTGTGRVPKRNVAVFEKRGEQWVLHPDVARYLAAKVAAYVQTGKVT